MQSTKKLKVFYVYARADQELHEALDRHLRVLKYRYSLETWFDRQILPGANWSKTIEDKLNQADIILLLISVDFIASDYCYNVEMQQAFFRHEKGQAKVIPIILRPCLWQTLPLNSLQVLPSGALPITSWQSRDDACVNTVREIERSIQDLLKMHDPNRNITKNLRHPPGWPVPAPTPPKNPSPRLLFPFRRILRQFDLLLNPLFTILEILLATRMVLKIIGANSASPFTHFVFSTTNIFLAPFNSVLPYNMLYSINIDFIQKIDVNTLFAMVAYFVALLLIRKFIISIT